MRLNGFFRFAWTLQLVVGVALFSVSFLIENQVLQAFFAAPAIALTLAVALELGKAMAIVWHRYLSRTGAAAYPGSTRIFSAIFRIGLVALSVLCSLLYLGVQLDRPHLEAVRAAELSAIDNALAQDLARIDTDTSARLEEDQARRATEYADARRDHQGQVAELERLLRMEMDNVVGGTFKGQRYKEIESRLTQARAERDQALATLFARHRDQAEQLAVDLAQGQGEARAARIEAAEARRRATRESSFDGDERTHDPRVVTLMRMAQSVFGVALSAPQFVFVFSLFLSVLVEIGILLAFDTLTLAAIPALAAQHREEVLREALVAEVSGSAERDAIRHREAMDRVRRGADRVVERAQAQAETLQHGGPTDSRKAA